MKRAAPPLTSSDQCDNKDFRSVVTTPSFESKTGIGQMERFAVLSRPDKSTDNQNSGM